MFYTFLVVDDLSNSNKNEEHCKGHNEILGKFEEEAADGIEVLLELHDDNLNIRIIYEIIKEKWIRSRLLGIILM